MLFFMIQTCFFFSDCFKLLETALILSGCLPIEQLFFFFEKHYSTPSIHVSIWAKITLDPITFNLDFYFPINFKDINPCPPFNLAVKSHRK